jgi:hypothetical protein
MGGEVERIATGREHARDHRFDIARFLARSSTWNG